MTLNRPEVRNAMNGTMWEELRSAVLGFERDPGVRVVILTGSGSIFSSGGDLKFQSEQRNSTRAERITEAKKLADLLRDMDVLCKPLIVKVNGPAYAGSLSLIAAGDIAVGIDTAKFAITEARIGMVPAMISTYVARRIGITNARRIFLTGRVFSADEAVRFGLLSSTASPADLDAAVETEVDMVLRCGPKALATTKRLLDYVTTHQHMDNYIYTIERAADTWESEEGQEGIASFFEKRNADWYQPK
jgi:methylglutaconyl-CoA hydratase